MSAKEARAHVWTPDELARYMLVYGPPAPGMVVFCDPSIDATKMKAPDRLTIVRQEIESWEREASRFAQSARWDADRCSWSGQATAYRCCAEAIDYWRSASLKEFPAE